MCTAILNEEFHGVELSFNGKPSTDILSMLKEAGFRWHNFKKIWYAKQNTKTLAVAEKLSDNKSVNTGTQTIQEIKTKAKTTEPYYPPYEKVGNVKIFKNSDVSIISEQGGYFADINAHIWMYYGQVVITDITNALSSGKTCKSLSVTITDNSEMPACTLSNSGLKTFKAIYNKFFLNGEIGDYKAYPREEKSINTFSPFVEIKPIKTPTKWTLAHTWKAILSGQIYNGKIDGKYSDDYAYDAASGYSTGCSFDLISFAQKLIESSSGWHCYPDKQDGDKVQLSVNCHSFDLRTVYYDEKCNYAEGRRRLEQEANELQQYNNQQLAKVIELNPEDYRKNKIYEVSYIEKDNNTGRYMYKKEKMQYYDIFYTDTVYPVDEEEYEKTETHYKVTDIKEEQIENEKLYRISDFHNRPHGDKYEDKRVINMGNWENIVTGYALKELLEEGHVYATIKESEYTIERAKNTCAKHINGTMSWCFGSCDTDYKQSLYKLNSEELRIKDDEQCLILA